MKNKYARFLEATACISGRILILYIHRITIYINILYRGGTFLFKKVIFITFCFILIIVVGTFIAVNKKYHFMKANIIAQNPEITRVESVTSIGGWGEWASEYSFVVWMDDKKYRVWSSGDGIITWQELIE